MHSVEFKMHDSRDEVVMHDGNPFVRRGRDEGYELCVKRSSFIYATQVVQSATTAEAELAIAGATAELDAAEKKIVEALK